MISLNIDYIKQSVDIASFTSIHDINIIVFCLLMIKNANNLVLELGPYAFDRFVEDKKQEIIESAISSQKKAKFANDIVELYIKN